MEVALTGLYKIWAFPNPRPAVLSPATSTHQFVVVAIHPRARKLHFNAGVTNVPMQFGINLQVIILVAIAFLGLKEDPTTMLVLVKS